MGLLRLSNSVYARAAEGDGDGGCEGETQAESPEDLGAGAGARSQGGNRGRQRLRRRDRQRARFRGHRDHQSDPPGDLMRAQPFSRPTLIAAVELLEGQSQARFNQMVLRLGLEDQIGWGLR